MNSGTQELPDSVTQPSVTRGTAHRGCVQFGLFELNMQTGELRKNGVRVRLQGKPFQILQALLEHPGEVVTRDELRKRLWPADTFVDFESGLNTAANRLRLTLGDSAENPRYIQTLSRTGYRFIADVADAPPRVDPELVPEAVAETAPAAIAPTPAAPAPPVAAPPSVATPETRIKWWAGVAIAACLVLLGSALYLVRHRAPAAPAFRQITFRRGLVDLARFAPDQQTVLYAAYWNGNPVESFMVSPGSPESRSLGFGGYWLMSISKTGELMLAKKRAVYRVPMNGGSPKLFLEGVGWTDWVPQGDVAVVRPDTGQAKVEFPRGKVVFSTAGYVTNLRVSPSGDAIAFIEHPMMLDDGGNIVWIDRSAKVHRVSEGWASAQGLAWSPNGREIWFTASRTGANRSLHAVGRSGAVRTVASIPGSMTLHDISTNGQVALSRDNLREAMWLGHSGSGAQEPEKQEKDISWFDLSQPEDISPDGRHLLFTEGGEGGGREYGVYLRDLTTGATTKLSDGEGLAFLPDGKNVVTMLPRDNTHLTVLPVGAGQPRTIAGNGLAYQWVQVFPDGKRLLVSGSFPGKPVRMYTQPVEGGALTPLNTDLALDSFRISRDGSRIAGVVSRSRKLAVISASGGDSEFPSAEPARFPVRWSSDGKRLLVRNFDEDGVLRLEWFDLATGKSTPWRTFRPADGESSTFGNVAVSQDEKTYVYAVQRRLSELFVVDGWS
jgi:DNA-binding winged helix-turn-helix (wHTH) protein/Tol biopolymer transport system component